MAEDDRDTVRRLRMVKSRHSNRCSKAAGAEK
jgi:hypothetical protein